MMEKVMSKSKNKKVMVVAGEISGDMHGAALIHELRNLSDNIDFFCIGSKNMKKEAGSLFCDSSSWGTIGLIDSLKKFPSIYLVYKRIKRFMVNEKPDLLLLIDYPGLNMRLVHAAKKRGIKTLYYIPPSKWAKTPEQVRDAASSIDKIITTFSGTYELYKSADASVEYVGHPIIDIIKPNKSEDSVRKKYNIPDGSTIIGLLPGSREREIKYLLPVLIKSAKEIKKKIPNAFFIVPMTSASFMQKAKISERKIRDVLKRELSDSLLTIDETYNIFQVLDFAVIASGTATLEAAYSNIPMVIIYKISLLTEIIARITGRLPKIFGIPNLMMGKKIIPELAQSDANPERISRELCRFYEDSSELKKQRDFLSDVKKKIGASGATKRAAEIVKEFLFSEE